MKNKIVCWYYNVNKSSAASQHELDKQDKVNASKAGQQNSNGAAAAQRIRGGGLGHGTEQ